jgi:hypothetical protein
MKTRRLSIAVMAAVAGMAGVHTTVLAQAAAQPAAQSTTQTPAQPAANAALEEITVTAARRVQDLQEVPVSIVAITGENLQVRGIDNLEEVSQGIPNVVITGGGGGIDVTDATDYYGTGEKYTSLSTNRFIAGVSGTVTTGADIIEVVGTGPYSITAGDSVTVAFALIAGDDVNDITNSGDSAQTHYGGNIPTALQNNQNLNNNISVFPNPANHDLNFMIKADKATDVTISLVNTLGQTVLNVSRDNIERGNNIIKIDTHDLPIGTYFYRVKTDDKISSGKIIISK